MSLKRKLRFGMIGGGQGAFIGAVDDDVAGDGLAGGAHGVHAAHLAAGHGDGGHCAAQHIYAYGKLGADDHTGI